MFHNIISFLLAPIVALVGWFSPQPIKVIEIPTEQVQKYVKEEVRDSAQEAIDKAISEAITGNKSLDVQHIQETLNRLKTEVEALQSSQKLGATFQTPKTIALFETTLANRISSSATSMTLTSATDKDGNTLASSTYGFIIDEGSASEEMVLADCTGTACTNMTRGISAVTGTTTVSTLQKSHNRGASVKITDGPFLLFAANVFKGTQNLENVIKYSSSVAACSANDDICDKAYIDGVAVAGAPDSGAATKGIVEKATGAEAASSKATGTGDTTAPLALTTDISTSTPYTAGNYVVATNSSGLINPQFISTSSDYRWTGSTTFTGLHTVNNATTTFYSATTTFATTTTAYYPIVAIGTSTPGGLNRGGGLVVATSTYIAGGLGVGIATTSAGNLQVSGNVQIGGSLSLSGAGLDKLVMFATPKNSVTTSPTRGVTFTDIDVTSSTTPDVARFVYINALIYSNIDVCGNTDGSRLKFRQNGSSVTDFLPSMETTCAVNGLETRAGASFIVPVDSDEIFEYNFDGTSGDDTGTFTVQIDLLGYIK